MRCRMIRVLCKTLIRRITFMTRKKALCEVCAIALIMVYAIQLKINYSDKMCLRKNTCMFNKCWRIFYT